MGVTFISEENVYFSPNLIHLCLNNIIVYKTGVNFIDILISQFHSALKFSRYGVNFLDDCFFIAFGEFSYGNRNKYRNNLYPWSI